MMTWFGVQADAFISTLSKNIGIYAIIFFLLCIVVSALLSLKKHVMQNVASLVMALVAAQTAFLLVGSIYDILVKRQGIQNAVAELMGVFPEVGASIDGGVALSKYVVSLVAVPALFMLLYGILSLAGFIVFRYGIHAARDGATKEEVGSNVSAAIKIASGVISAIAAIIAFFSPANTLLDLMTLPPIILAAFATVRGILAVCGKLRIEASPARKVISLLVGAVTGAVTFVVIFFPFLAAADLAVIGAQAIPDEALACYEQISAERDADVKSDAVEDTEPAESDIIGGVFHYSIEAKKYLDSYDDTFVSKIYPKLGIYNLHCTVAPVAEMRTIMRMSVVLGSYYYCEKNDVDFPDARARLSAEIAEVSDDADLNDILQALFCTAAADALMPEAEADKDAAVPEDTAAGEVSGEVSDEVLDERTAELRELQSALYSSARLAQLEELDADAVAEENDRLADVYMALCRLVAMQSKQGGTEGITPEQLVLFGELLDAMNASYSFRDTVSPILYELQSDSVVGAFIDPEAAMQNVAWGEYSYATYMTNVTEQSELARP